MLIITFVLTTIVVIASWLSGKLEVYDIGVNLITAGIVLTALSMPLFYRSHHRARTRINLDLSIEERNKIVPDTYYDYFAGVAFAPIVALSIGFLLIISTGYVGQRNSQQTNLPFVGSIRPNIVEMHEIARQHNDDAYLLNATYYFSENKPYIFISSFGSVKNPSQSIVVTLENKGEYSIDFYEHSSSIQLTIADGDWLIDSQEAIAIFAQNENLRACINFPQSRVKRLDLTRAYSLNNRDVKWCLWIEECSAIKSRTCIDANTGEELILND